MDQETEMNLINLLDEEGVEHEFEIVDALEYEETQYLALVPVYDEPADNLEDSGELVILRVSDELDEDGEQFLEAIEDEEEYDQVAGMFMERLEDSFDFVEVDDEAEDDE